MQKKFDIMAAGHLCFDVIPKFPDSGSTQISEVLSPGKLINMEGVQMSTGGPVSNTGIGLKKLGLNVCFNARIGDDEFGELVIKQLEKQGNSEGINIVNNAVSSFTVVLAPPGIDRIFLHCPGSNNDFSSKDLPFDLISDCRHFHFGYPPLMQNIYADDGEELLKIFKIAKEAGAITSCDMALPDPVSQAGKVDWNKILQKVLPYVDIFLPSIEEAFFMLEKEEFLSLKKKYNNAELIQYLGIDQYSRIADKLLSYGCKMTSLKAGFAGWYFKTGDLAAINSFPPATFQNPEKWQKRELWCPAYKVPEVLSATGSGDSSIAGFLAAFIKELPIEECLKYAVCLGYQNVQTLDAVSGIQDWDKTTQIIRSAPDMIEVPIETGKWIWDKTYSLWHSPDDQT